MRCPNVVGLLAGKRGKTIKVIIRADHVDSHEFIEPPKRCCGKLIPVVTAIDDPCGNSTLSVEFSCTVCGFEMFSKESMPDADDFTEWLQSLMDKFDEPIEHEDRTSRNRRAREERQKFISSLVDAKFIDLELYRR